MLAHGTGAQRPAQRRARTSYRIWILRLLRVAIAASPAIWLSDLGRVDRGVRRACPVPGSALELVASADAAGDRVMKLWLAGERLYEGVSLTRPHPREVRHRHGRPGVGGLGEQPVPATRPRTAPEVRDIDETRANLVSRGVDVSKVYEQRATGSICQGARTSYASFSDPDCNGWLLQETTTRLPGWEWE